MADELIDICDENNKQIGIQKMKSEAHKTGLWHRASHIWIYNSKGEILLQLRAKDKELYPDMWDISAAGHVESGEDPEISALREVKEEIALPIKKEDLEFIEIRKTKQEYKDLKNNEFYYVYLLKFDGNIEDLKIQDEELQSIQFLPIDKVEKELRKNPERYVPHGDYWFEILDKIKRKL